MQGSVWHQINEFPVQIAINICSICMLTAWRSGAAPMHAALLDVHMSYALYKTANDCRYIMTHIMRMRAE